VEVCQAGGLCVQGVEVGGLEDWVAVTAQVAVALVVCDDEDDVWGFWL